MPPARRITSPCPCSNWRREANNSSAISRDVEGSADTVGSVAGTLSGEVDQFLAAMQDTKGDRRVFERLPGHGFPVRLGVGDTQRDATVVDVSLGGIALRLTANTLAPGTDVSVLVPGTKLTLLGRVARREGEVASISFRQNAETVALAEQLIAVIGQAQAA